MINAASLVSASLRSAMSDDPYDGLSLEERWALATPEQREQFTEDLARIDAELAAPRELINREEEATLSAYDAAVDQIATANPDIDVPRFHRFVHAAEGDFEQALRLYRDDTAAARQEAMASLGIDERRLAELQARGGSLPATGGDPTARLHAAIEQAAKGIRR